MSLNQLLKGKKVVIELGYDKKVALKIDHIKENVHRYSDRKVAFKNYSINFTNGDLKIYNSLDDIVFHIPFYKRIFKK